MEPEIKPTVAEPSLTDLQEHVRWLRKQLTIVLVLGILISGTLTIYLLRQWKYTHTDLTAFRPQASALIAAYNRENAPAIDKFIQNLQDYGKTHPDFVPILVKYRLMTNNAPVAPAAPAN